MASYSSQYVFYQRLVRLVVKYAILLWTLVRLNQIIRLTHLVFLFCITRRNQLDTRVYVIAANIDSSLVNKGSFHLVSMSQLDTYSPESRSSAETHYIISVSIHFLHIQVTTAPRSWCSHIIGRIYMGHDWARFYKINAVNIIAPMSWIDKI